MRSHHFFLGFRYLFMTESSRLTALVNVESAVILLDSRELVEQISLNDSRHLLHKWVGSTASVANRVV